MRQNLPAFTLCFDVEFHLMLYHLEDYPSVQKRGIIRTARKLGWIFQWDETDGETVGKIQSLILDVTNKSDISAIDSDWRVSGRVESGG